MANAAKKGFWKDFRRFFFRGLATLLPTVLTIVLMVKCYEFVQQNISIHITNGASYLLVVSTDKNEHWKNYPKWDEEEDLSNYIIENKPGVDVTNPDERKSVSDDAEERKKIRIWKLQQQWSHGPGSLFGFFLAIILVYILGRVLASFFGRKLWQLFEAGVQQIPGFKQVYPYVKQVTDYLFGENKIEFTRVVAVSYPRKGIWSVGLVTGEGFKSMGSNTGEKFITVFIPSSPTPVTGYVIHVNNEDVIDLPISIEEALRFTVSGGVIVPGHEALPTQMVELGPGPTKVGPGKDDK